MAVLAGNPSSARRVTKIDINMTTNGTDQSDRYASLSREALVDVLRRRDAQAHYGLIWEQREIDPDRALNRDFVGLTLEQNHSCGSAPWQHMLMEGDNYDALRALVSHYAGAVNLIYIDPPYNTGRRDFVYNDYYVDPTNRFRHSTWIEFMYQRLTLARDLLAKDGVIFVSIDDHEIFNLGLLMNQVFGEKSFVANCIWQKRYSRENREAIGDAHEYLLIYSPDPNGFKARRGRIPLTEKQAAVYRNPDNPNETNPAKRWRAIPMTAQGYRPNQMYKIVSPSGKEHRPPEGRCWSLIEPEFLKLKAQQRIYWGKDGSSQPGIIRFLSEVDGAVPWTWWPHEEVGHTDEARKEIQSFFGTQTAFDTPKPTRLMRRVLEIGAPEKNAIVLDFFAGSGTMGQAVLEMNVADGGHRRFILVANTESTEEKPDKNIARDVCAARLRKVIDGYESTSGEAIAGIGGGFAYLKAALVPMHRLESGLTDEMVWSHALLMFDHPMQPFGGALTISVHRNTRIIYCRDTKNATVERIRALLKNEHPIPTTIFTWTPSKVRDVVGKLRTPVTIVSILEDLRTIFRRGTARVREESWKEHRHTESVEVTEGAVAL